jgi:hypothetical protein
LSYFLWGTLPDDELISIAVQEASGSIVLEKQVRRMLKDPRSEQLR